PRCRAVSCRVHSRYTRRLADAAAGGQRVVIRLAVRRFFCNAAGCPARTFAEQFEGLTTAYAPRTLLVTRMLAADAPALAWRARWVCRPGGGGCCGWTGPCRTRAGAASRCSALIYPEPGIIRICGWRGLWDSGWAGKPGLLAVCGSG